MTKDFLKYLEPKGGYIEVTPEVLELAEKVTDGSKSDEEKARKTYEYIRSQEFAISPAAPAHELVERDVLDCGSRHTLLSSMHRSLGIPSRIAMFECPFAVYYGSIDHLPMPDIMRTLFKTGLYAVQDYISGANHYASEAYYNGKWNLLDATANPKLCSYFDEEKKEKCMSDGNISSALGCKRIGTLTDIPSDHVLMSTAGKIGTDMLGLKDLFIDKISSESLITMLSMGIDELSFDDEGIL